MKNYKKSDTDFTDFFTIPDEEIEKAGPHAEQIRDESRTQSPGEPVPIRKEKPANATGHPAPAILAAGPETINPEASNMIPSSAAVLQGAQTIIHADDLPGLAVLIKAGSNNVKEVRSSETQLTVIRGTKKKAQRIAMAIGDPKAFSRDNTNILRLYIYAINQINRQAVTNGKITKRFIYLDPADFVRTGVYKNKHVARKEMLAAAAALKTLWFEGEITIGKDTITQMEVPIFDAIGKKFVRGLLPMGISEKLNWEFFATTYVPFPESLYKLKGRPLSLATYIQLLACNNCERIRETNGFNISVKAVHSWLNLPGIDECKNPNRDIITQIENATAEIEKAVPEIDIDVCNTGDGSIKDYMRGHINIMYSGTLLEFFKKRADTKTEIILKNAKRKESIVKKAQALNLAKKMEKDSHKGKETG